MENKKMTALLFTFTFTLGTILAGCGGSGKPASEVGETGPTPKTSDTVQTAERIKIEIMTDGAGSKLPEGENDRIKMKLDEKLNTDLRLTLFGGDPANQLNLRMAGGDYPDLINITRLQMQEYAKKGLLLDLTPYMDKLTQVREFIGEDSLIKGTVDGKIYALPKRASIPFFNIWIRKDWLDNLKLEVPTTLEEFYNVAKAFTEQDPDGNGKKDTYGLTGVRLGTFDPIFSAFGMGTLDTFYMKNGTLTNFFMDPDMKEALKFINEMINAGVVDPDILANTGTQHEKNAFQGKAGMIWNGFPRMTLAANVEESKAVNPDAEWVQVPALKGPGGQYAGHWDTGVAPGLHVIPKAIEKDPAKLERLFDLLNYVASPEGNSLVAHGEEGRHWNRENGKIVRTELRAKEVVFMYQLLGRNEMEYLESGYPKEAIEFSANTPRVEIFNGYLDIPDGYNPADAYRFMEEEKAKFIYGKRPISEYDDFLEKLLTTFKYQLMLDSAEKQLKELEIIKN
ncbi:extracellular solute-binding protein [Paenibacillus sp. J2TS4]|uniref:extracellular solute-binding protein n=1 Tax=Paenibacillus sp. J2TS4 TaxID=2807194 RepID=UPI001B1741E2|nr:extracellular solute-binding protein [Paenibacillus sp. J2TS4]GIP31776.1 putative ABC transporter peptide-binding protein YtcQ [Paenibacillus sp. J2TS4]